MELLVRFVAIALITLFVCGPVGAQAPVTAQPGAQPVAPAAAPPAPPTPASADAVDRVLDIAAATIEQTKWVGVALGGALAVAAAIAGWLGIGSLRDARRIVDEGRKIVGETRQQLKDQLEALRKATTEAEALRTALDELRAIQHARTAHAHVFAVEIGHALQRVAEAEAARAEQLREKCTQAIDRFVAARVALGLGEDYAEIRANLARERRMSEQSARDFERVISFIEASLCERHYHLGDFAQAVVHGELSCEFNPKQFAIRPFNLACVLARRDGAAVTPEALAAIVQRLQEALDHAGRNPDENEGGRDYWLRMLETEEDFATVRDREAFRALLAPR